MSLAFKFAILVNMIDLGAESKDNEEILENHKASVSIWRPLTQKSWHELFEFGVFLKGFNGIWETISGAMFLFLSRGTITNWFFLATRNELIENPNDKVIIFFARVLQNSLSHTKVFAALYLLVHGLLNIFLAVQLYRDKHWAYLVMIWTIIIFIGYQIYRISIHHSIALIFFTIFDIFFVILAWHEYKYRRDKKNV